MGIEDEAALQPACFSRLYCYQTVGASLLAMAA